MLLLRSILGYIDPEQEDYKTMPSMNKYIGAKSQKLLQCEALQTSTPTQLSHVFQKINNCKKYKYNQIIKYVYLKYISLEILVANSSARFRWSKLTFRSSKVRVR